MISTLRAVGTVASLLLSGVVLACDSNGPGEAARCLASSVSAGHTATWITKADGSVWRYGTGGGRTAIENGIRPPPERVAAVKEAWVPSAFLHLNARNDFICVVSSDHALRCILGGGLSQPDVFLDNVLLSATGPIEPGPIYALKLDGSLSCCVAHSGTDKTLDVFGTDVASVAAGEGSACVIRRDGSVWCFTNAQAPRSVPMPAPAVSIAASVARACAVLSDGEVRCWDPVESQPDVSATTRIDVSGVGVLAMGANHACVLKTDKTVWCWGSNRFGESGHAPAGDPSRALWETPQQVMGLESGVLEISAGYTHTCARLSDNTVWCWGSSGFGQIGSNKGTVTSPTALEDCE